VADESELRRWILQFGAEAEVLAPASLRGAIADGLRAAAAPYREPRRAWKGGRNARRAD